MHADSASLPSPLGQGHVEAALELISRRAYVDAAGSEGSTPLRVAARNGGVGANPMPNFAKVVALLLARGANARAAHLSDVETVAATQQALVASSASELAHLSADGKAVNAEHPTHGRTALHEAALAGRAESVLALVRQGADLNGRDKAGFTSLELAALAEGAGASQRSLEAATEATETERCEAMVALIRLGSELGTVAQASRVVWRASLLGRASVVQALAAHPRASQSCSGPKGRDVVADTRYTPVLVVCPLCALSVPLLSVQVARVPSTLDCRPARPL